MTTDVFDPYFATLALSSQTIYLQGSVDTLGSASPHVNISTVQNYWIPLPPLNEQQKIVAIIGERCNEIEQQIARKQVFIEKLVEYKKSLIYEVVTGKREGG